MVVLILLRKDDRDGRQKMIEFVFGVISGVVLVLLFEVWFVWSEQRWLERHKPWDKR